MSKAKDLAVLSVEERESETGIFPVVIVSDIIAAKSESGNVYFKTVRASVPVSGATVDQARNLFPEGAIVRGHIEKYHEDEPYTWITPEGEERQDTVRYRFMPEEHEEQKPAPKATIPTEVGADEPVQEEAPPY